MERQRASGHPTWNKRRWEHSHRRRLLHGGWARLGNCRTLHLSAKGPDGFSVARGGGVRVRDDVGARRPPGLDVRVPRIALRSLALPWRCGARAVQTVAAGGSYSVPSRSAAQATISRRSATERSARMTVAAIAQGLVSGLAERIALHGNASPQVDDVAQPPVRGEAARDDTALAGLSGDRCHAAQAAQRVIVAPPQGVVRLCQQRGADYRTDSGQGSQDGHVTLLFCLSRR